MPFSRRIESVAPSMTLAMSARAGDLRRSGVDVVDLSAGEPDFPTPPAVLDAARAYLEKGRIGYTPAAGLPDLRDAVADRHAARFGPAVPREAVVVTCGAKHALYLALQVLCNEGDEVVFASPYWVSYPEMARLAGCRHVTVATRAEDGFRVDPAALAAALSDRTRVVILNSPSNPTGAILTRANLAEIAEVLSGRDLHVVSDEIYDRLYYGDEPPASIMDVAGEELRARVVVVNGVSKTYAMTGWRIGYAVGPVDVVKRMIRLSSHETSNASTLGQMAALAAITGDQSIVEDRRHVFAGRRGRMLAGLRAVPGMCCAEPEGAFYAFPRVDELYGRRRDGREIGGSMDLAEVLLEECGVATVPGKAFGEDAYLRLSYATSDDRIDEGLRRISSLVDELA